MSEKDEALRLADRMAEGTGLDTQWDAAKELRRLHAENERQIANRDNLLWIVRELSANKSENEAEIERLREEVRNWKKSFVGHVYVKDEDYAELISKRDALKTENERLRGLLAEIKDLAWSCGADSLFDRIDAALRREPGDG